MRILNFLKRMTLWSAAALVVAAIGAAFAWHAWFAGPVRPVITEPRLQAAVIELSADKSLVSFISELRAKDVIKSEKVALSIIHRLGIEKKAKQGIYVFAGGEDVFRIASRLGSGSYGYAPVKVTIPEGFTVQKMAGTYASKMADIKESDFIAAASPFEGYLFPDTYFFYPYATSSTVISAMIRNFDRKAAAFKGDFAALAAGASSTAFSASSSPSVTERTYGMAKSADEIIIMASILEKEVQTSEDKAAVADLFWRRIKEGMPLQADSTLTYVTGKTSSQLSLRDLRENSPYNSYTNRGLPPTPISNPGIESIRAALYPKKNDYVYFLSDEDGNTHFSKTYAEHLRLKRKYLP